MQRLFLVVVITILPAVAQVYNIQSQTNIHHWSGYVASDVTGTATATQVSGDWIVPTIACSQSFSSSVVWVGLGGFGANTLGQIGTGAVCKGGKPEYYAWYEFLPNEKSQQIIPSSEVNPQPGDKISANVTFSGTQFTVTLQNKPTVGKLQVFPPKTETVSAAVSWSAEWIVEGPLLPEYPLADFDKVVFDRCYATVDKLTRKLSGFESLIDVTPLSIMQSIFSSASRRYILRRACQSRSPRR